MKKSKEKEAKKDMLNDVFESAAKPAADGTRQSGKEAIARADKEKFKVFSR